MLSSKWDIYVTTVLLRLSDHRGRGGEILDGPKGVDIWGKPLFSRCGDAIAQLTATMMVAQNLYRMKPAKSLDE